MSLKAKRRITLWGLASLQGWIELESDPAIDRLCERPLVVADVKPQRVVDFWASGPQRNELIFLLRSGEVGSSQRKPFNPGFETWANEVGCEIRQIAIERPSAAKERWLNDWVEILQCVATYKDSITPTQLEQVRGKLTERTRMIDVLGTSGLDADLARGAVYLSVYQGSHRFTDLQTSGLGGDLEVEPI